MIRHRAKSGAWGGSTDPSTCGLWVVGLREAASSAGSCRGPVSQICRRDQTMSPPAGPRCNVRSTLLHSAAVFSSIIIQSSHQAQRYTGPSKAQTGPLVSSRRDPDSRSQQLSEGCGLAGCVLADSRDPLAAPAVPAIRHQPSAISHQPSSATAISQGLSRDRRLQVHFGMMLAARLQRFEIPRCHRDRSCIKLISNHRPSLFV